LGGCKTWSLTRREEYSLRVIDNSLLRRIFGPQRERVTGDWIKSLSDYRRNLYYSQNITMVIKSRMRWAEHVARIREKRNA